MPGPWDRTHAAAVLATLQPGQTVTITKGGNARRSGYAPVKVKPGDAFEIAEVAPLGVWVQVPDSLKWAWLGYEMIEEVKA